MEKLQCKCCGNPFWPWQTNSKYKPICQSCYDIQQAKIQEMIDSDNLDKRALRELFDIRAKYYDALAILLYHFPDHGEKTGSLGDSLKEIFDNIKRES